MFHFFISEKRMILWKTVIIWKKQYNAISIVETKEIKKISRDDWSISHLDFEYNIQIAEQFLIVLLISERCFDMFLHLFKSYFNTQFLEKGVNIGSFDE
jgi:hypothetical protein